MVELGSAVRACRDLDPLRSAPTQSGVSALGGLTGETLDFALGLADGVLSVLLGEAVALALSELDGEADGVPLGSPVAVLNGTTTAGRASIGADPVPWSANAPSPKEVSPIAPDTAHKLERCDIGTLGLLSSLAQG